MVEGYFLLKREFFQEVDISYCIELRLGFSYCI